MENIINCSMCFMKCASNIDLIRHIVRCHRLDPRFKVQCTYNGCGATYKNWSSFRQHVWRNHGNNANEIFNTTYELFHMDEDDINNDVDLINDTDEDNNQPMSAIEELQWRGAKFLLDIRENCKISQTAIERLIDGVEHLNLIYSAIFMKEIGKLVDPTTKLIHFDVIEEKITRTLSPTIMFTPVKTKKSFDNFLINNFKIVLPESHVISETLKWVRAKNGQLDLINVHRQAYIVPFLKNLRWLLSNEEIRNNIDKPRIHQDGFYQTVLDGSRYRESEFFKNNPNALTILFYYDDLGAVNPLGNCGKSQKLAMFYWVLGNLDPQVRSSKNAVQLFAIVKTEWLKENGALEILLEPFIKDINILQNEGIRIQVKGRNVKVYKGSLLFCPGDNPASAMLGGFKESVSSYRFCRQCMVTKDEWKNNYSANNFILRNKVIHESHISALSEPNVPRRITNFWKKRYGVNKRSSLLDIKNFDVTTDLPQDAMHVLLEGLVELACRKLLQFLIIGKGIFTLDVFNDWRANFNYYRNFREDIPTDIYREQLLDNGKLRQTAAQIFVLAHMLPYLIADSVINNEEEDVCTRLWSHIQLLQIINVCLSYEIHDESVDILSRMIELYLPSFNVLYPDCSIPKMHFLVHIPENIRLFGPARQTWCFRFESAHAYFKSLIPVVRNFKNMAYTCSYRHQANLCSKLTPFPGDKSTKFLYKGHGIKPGETVLLNNLPYCQLFDQHIAEIDRLNCQLLRTPQVNIYGTTYASNYVILLYCQEQSFPIFGEINEIFVYGDKIFFIFSYLQTIFFCDKLNGYSVQKLSPNLRDIIIYENLIFPHPLIFVKIRNSSFVGLLNHERNEYYAY